MVDVLPYSPVGTLHVLPPEIRFIIYALTLKPRVLEFELEGRGAQIRICPRTALSFRYLPIIAHVCAEMRTYVFGNEDGECRYTPVAFEYHILAASLGPDGFDVVEKLVTSPTIASAGVAPDDFTEKFDEDDDDDDGSGGTRRASSDDDHSEPHEEEEEDQDDERVAFFDDFIDPQVLAAADSADKLRMQTTAAKEYPSTPTPASVTRGCITCFAGSSRRTVRGVFSPKIDRVVIRPHHLSRLNLIFNPVAPDLVYLEQVPPIRLLSHRRTPLRSTFTKYLQAKAEEFVRKHDERVMFGGTGVNVDGRGDNNLEEEGSPGGTEVDSTARAEPGRLSIVEDQRSTSGRYEIITVSNEVSILREIPWVQLPRGRFHQFRW